MNTFFEKNRKLGIRGAVLAALVLGGSEGAQAQFRKGNFVPYSSVSVGLGSSSYYGDMASYRRPLASTFSMIRWSATANYTRHFTPRFGARASFAWARITGDDFKMQQGPRAVPNLFARNLHFRNDLKEFALTGIFKLIPDSRSYDRRPQFSPYVFLGIAAVAHSPVARVPDLDGDRWVKLQPLGTEGQGSPGLAKPYSLVQLAIPFGFGVRYKINARFDVGAELGFRFTSTDYLDDVARNYPDPTLLKDDLARAMSNRSAEPTAARKGGDRTAGLQKFLADSYQITDPSIDPFVAIKQTDYGTPGTARGSNPGRNDTYMTGSVHITYMLGSPIKCPPLK